MEECSIFEIMYASSHTPDFIYGELEYVLHVNSICQFIQSM
jgi:hypothetical protein